MNFFNSLTSAVVNAGQAALSSSNSVPSLPQYSVTDAISSYVSPIWTLHDGVKKDDQSLVSIFSFESTSTSQNRALLPLARNALRKLRALRHPNILKFLDGTETDTSIWIVTEHVHSLAVALQENQVAEESKLFGLLHISTALAFLNKDGASVHGNLRPQSVWITQGSEWKLGGMEMCTRVDDDAGVLWSTSGALMPDANAFASPEVKKSGWAILKEFVPSLLTASSRCSRTPLYLLEMTPPHSTHITSTSSYTQFSTVLSHQTFPPPHYRRHAVQFLPLSSLPTVD